MAVVEIHLGSSFSKIRAEKKDKNKLCHHHIISMVCPVIDRIALGKRAREKSLSFCKTRVRLSRLGLHVNNSTVIA